jgi:hypothetical protein
MPAELDLTDIGRRPLDLDGWGDRSVWGWDDQAGSLFAQLWRDRDDDDDEDDDDRPETWITPPSWPVCTDPVVLAELIAGATVTPVSAVLTAMARSVTGRLGDALTDRQWDTQA